jgi:hypothetical protein
MRALSSTWRITQSPEDSNRHQHQHEHRDHALGGEAVLLDPADRQKREAEDERQCDGEHCDTGHLGGISQAKIERDYPLALGNPAHPACVSSCLPVDRCAGLSFRFRLEGVFPYALAASGPTPGRGCGTCWSA